MHSPSLLGVGIWPLDKVFISQPINLHNTNFSLAFLLGESDTVDVEKAQRPIHTQSTLLLDNSVCGVAKSLRETEGFLLA